MTEPTQGDPTQPADPTRAESVGAAEDAGSIPSDGPSRRFSSSGPSGAKRGHLFDSDSGSTPTHREPLFSEQEPLSSRTGTRGHLFHSPDPLSGVEMDAHYGSTAAPGQPAPGQPSSGPSGSGPPGAEGQGPPVVGQTQPHSSGEVWGQEALEIGEYGGTWVRPLDHLPTGHTGEHQAVAVAGATTVGAGAGAAGRSAKAKRTGPKPIRGPRFSVSPVIAGFGLLSLLIVIAIMAFLAVKILGGVEDSSSVGRGMPGVLAPDAESPGGGAQIGGGATGSANAAACAADKQTIETAAEAYSVTNGTVPSNVDELVAAGWLKENPGTFNLEPSGDGFTVVGIGTCKGTD